MLKSLGFLFLFCIVLPAQAAQPSPSLPAAANPCVKSNYKDKPNDERYVRQLAPLLSDGKWKELKLQSEAILKQEPNDFLVLTMLGFAHLGQEDNEGAIRALEQAMAVRPDAYVAETMLGGVYKQAGRYTEARNAYQHVVQCNPQDEAALHGLADTYTKMKDFANAARVYSTLSSLNRKDYQSWMQSILAYKLANKPQAAAESLAELKQASPAAARCVTRLMTTRMPCCRLDKDPDCAEALNPPEVSSEPVLH